MFSLCRLLLMFNGKGLTVYRIEFYSTIGWAVIGDSPTANTINDLICWAAGKYARHSLRIVYAAPQAPRLVVARRAPGASHWIQGAV